MKVLSTILTVFVLSVSFCDCHRILAIFPHKLRSHRGVLEPLGKALARKGHQVDVISNYVLKEPFPNYTNIIDLPIPESYPRMDYQVITSPVGDEEWLIEMNKDMCELLGHPKVAELIKKPPTNPPYDFIIVHSITGHQCFAAIGYRWNVPVAMVSTTILYPQMNSFVGNPLNLAIFPYHLRFYKEKLDFWERLHNVLSTHHEIRYYHKNAHLQDQYIKKYLGDDMPSYLELEKNTALLFTNSHYSYHGIKPITPAVIEIGGINVQKNSSEPVEPKLKKIMNGSRNGFVYFSFGSLTTIETIPHEILVKFYKAMEKLSPINVIMKVSNPSAMPKNVPKNIEMFTWLPQQKILQHPNIKAFVTHGGGLGTQEATYYGVPMICVPFFADQLLHCDILSTKNVSIKLNITTASQKDYDEAFHEIVYNPVYKTSMEKFSRLYKDRPMSPEDTVNYWVEYIIRHGKNALRSPAVDMTWWQAELLDVYAFLFSCALAALAAAFVLLRVLFSLFAHVIFPFKGSIQSKTKLIKKLN